MRDNASITLAILLGVVMGLTTGLFVGYGLATQVERDKAVREGVGVYSWDEKGRETFVYRKR